MKNLKMVKSIHEANAITHGGKFHVDEVFATAFLCNLFEDVKLIRVLNLDNKAEYNTKIIYDIGGGEFDHHQINAKIRDDGIKYSSFGLLWKKFGREYLKKIKCKDIDFAWMQMDSKIVKTIDKIDNFQMEKEFLNNYTISNIIERFNPPWNADVDEDNCFIEAVEFANVIFNKEADNILDRIKAKEYLAKEYHEFKKNYLVLEKYIPYNDFIAEKDKSETIQFVIYPSKRNGIEVRTVFNRKKFPPRWNELSKKEFFKEYGVDGLIYCHTNGKLCITETIEEAIKIIELT